MSKHYEQMETMARRHGIDRLKQPKSSTILFAALSAMPRDEWESDWRERRT